MKTKKICKVLGTLVLFASVIWGGVSCNQNVPPAEYTVTFNSDGGSAVPAQKVKEGEKATKPATNPTKAGYTFEKWMNGDKEYDFNAAVTKNLTLKASWKAVTYKITYELNDGKGAADNPATYTIETKDFTIKDPVSGPVATPNFAGWYSDKELTKPATTTIKKGSTGDLTFYAKWSAKSVFKVTFDSNGGSKVDVQNVTEGEKAKKPTDPTKDGYTFEKWMNGDKEYDFNTVVTKDLTLQASWKAKEADSGNTGNGGNDNNGENNNSGDNTGDSGNNGSDNSTIIVTKNADGSFSFKDGTYEAEEFQDNETTKYRIKFTLPEAQECRTGDSWLITGTINFGDNPVYKQMYMIDKNGAVFGWNFMADWTNGLSGNKTVKAEGTIGDDPKPVTEGTFVFDNPVEDAQKTSITITDLKLTYKVFDPNAVLVLFDPETYEGEIKEIGSEKYAVITVDGYNTAFDVNPAIDCVDATSFVGKFCAAEKNVNYNITIAIKDLGDDGNFDVANLTMYQATTEPKEFSVGFAEKTQWNSTRETKVVNKVQIIVQDSSDGFKPQNNVVIYLGKVYAKK